MLKNDFYSSVNIWQLTRTQLQFIEYKIKWHCESKSVSVFVSFLTIILKYDLKQKMIWPSSPQA